MEALTTKICKKQDLGVHNNLFGGTMLSWIDEAAAAYVMEICRTPSMVTFKMDEVLFKSPVKENNLIKLYGIVKGFGKSSCTSNIEARKYDVYTGEETVVCSTEIVFVRIGDDGRPIKISEEVKKAYAQRLDGLKS